MVPVLLNCREVVEGEELMMKAHTKPEKPSKRQAITVGNLIKENSKRSKK